MTLRVDFMLNKVILIGNVGSDPDIRMFPNGGRVANFSLATSEYWTDKTGQRQSRTEWHRISVYNEALVRLVEKAVHKGSKLYVEGMIRSRKYTSQQDGTERTAVEIALQGFDHTIKLLDPRPSTEVSHSNSNDERKQASYGAEDVVENGDHEDIIDDEIPF